MKEEYQKISLLKHRNKITSKDIAFIKEMHQKYLYKLEKNICWGCPLSIREAMWDLLHYVEKNPIQENETSENITEQRSPEAGISSESIPPKRRGRKPSTGSNE